MLRVIDCRLENDTEFVRLENGKWYALDYRYWNGEYYRAWEVEDGLSYGYIRGTECEIRPVEEWDDETDTGKIIGYEVD